MVCTCLSPWHDIPLHLGDGVFNFVVEIPKESSVKIEFATYKPSHRSSRTQRRGIFDTSCRICFLWDVCTGIIWFVSALTIPRASIFHENMKADVCNRGIIQDYPACPDSTPCRTTMIEVKEGEKMQFLCADGADLVTDFLSWSFEFTVNGFII